MAILRTERVSLDSFGILISSLIDDLSIGRAQIVVGQIRQVIETGDHDRLVILTTSETGRDSPPLAAVVALLQAGIESDSISDVATILHAGTLRQLDAQSLRSVIQSLSLALDQELQRHGICFVQWATDPPPTDDPASRTAGSELTNRIGSPFDWCTGFGFQPIGTLDYLCGPVSNEIGKQFASDTTNFQASNPLCFDQFPWTQPNAFSELVDLVELTYLQTLDCPELSAYRTTEQVLTGYRTANAFTPSLWFTVTDDREERVGCVILATHPPAQTKEARDDATSVGSVEIVYMGLVPTARGRGLGTQMVQKAFDVAREVGADQVLLAVDQINHPAKAIYNLAGLKPIVHEMVWVKSLAAAGENR